ncbi:MAG: glycoside hydrolase family 9 protein [candidate division KSB1 bacterium]|nr:glycoside hydrolase family 9 protein [candidate division KSB1 bacterium]
MYRERNEISARLGFPDSSRDRKGFNPIEYPDLRFSYTVRVIAEGTSFRVIVDLDDPLPAEWNDRVGFNLELFPGALFGKSFRMDEQTGFFPPQPNGPVLYDPYGDVQIEPLASGRELTVAPENDTLRLTIRSFGEPLELLDGRFRHNNGWFIVRSRVKPNQTRAAVEWLITPNVIRDWCYRPVIQVSQVGYHPAQSKIAVIERDPRERKIQPAVVYQIDRTGLRERLRIRPKPWGKFLRYDYLQLDFSDLKEPGVYVIRYGESLSNLFRIAEDIYSRHVWQPTLEYFLPVQMCHMRVNEGYRVWHGLCHMDDARMAPVNHNHFDGYLQGPSTLTPFEPLQHVPGLNVGGWHDAGDYDLRVESQAEEIYILALAYEEFGIDYDVTTVDQKQRLVEIHQPDGVPDILQQIEHGALSIVAGYEALGRLYRGIICPTLRQYVLLGDGSTMTDGLVYDASLPADSIDCRRSGKADDRWVFTEINPRRELQVAACLAAAARPLKRINAELAQRCCAVAESLVVRNTDQHGVLKFNAAAELFLTNGNKAYKKILMEEKEAALKAPERCARVLGRVLPEIADGAFTPKLESALREFARQINERAKETPYGVPYRPNIWGDGWTIQSFGVTQYFLHKAFPEIFPKAYMLNALNFVLGCHPGSNTASFASGVGTRSLTVAYGANRADWSYIPGGVASGTALIRPDLPELKVWPYFWQQTEYVMGGGASNFMFLALAANSLLSQP